jgi:hypothetical protein
MAARHTSSVRNLYMLMLTRLKYCDRGNNSTLDSRCAGFGPGTRWSVSHSALGIRAEQCSCHRTLLIACYGSPPGRAKRSESHVEPICGIDRMMGTE